MTTVIVPLLKKPPPSPKPRFDPAEGLLTPTQAKQLADKLVGKGIIKSYCLDWGTFVNVFKPVSGSKRADPSRLHYVFVSEGPFPSGGGRLGGEDYPYCVLTFDAANGSREFYLFLHFLPDLSALTII